MGVTIGTTIKEAMEAKKVRAADLSRETGISQTVISRYINDKRMPGVKNLVKIANALDMDVSLFLGCL